MWFIPKHTLQFSDEMKRAGQEECKPERAYAGGRQHVEWMAGRKNEPEVQ